VPEGIVKKIVSEKGFGFITPDGGADDVFFHHSALEGGQFEKLAEGDRVQFGTEDGAKGPRATNMQPIA
jgi:CspA family cold shock protein